MEDLVGRLWRELNSRFESAGRLLAMWRPTVTVPGWMAPGLALGALLSLVLLSGVAVLSFGVMFTAALMAYLILEKVFGLSLEISA